ncbi:MAG TPA: hypothetical protein ENG62_00010 [Thermoplasmatales archaeon]|nr:hypothetical protein [Thermoplasmatales archaeon]
MRIRCELILDFKDEKQAKDVYQAVNLDDKGFIESHVEGNKIIAYVESKTIPSLLHTLDDYLACLSIAEKISGGED